jgi:hypothetical protein
MSADIILMSVIKQITILTFNKEFFMKKMLFVLFLVATVAFAQRELAFGQGDNAFNAGLTLNGLGDDVRPGIALVYDRMLSDMFSVGAEFSFYQNNFPSDYRFDDRDIRVEYKNTYITPLFRVGFHPFGIPGLKGDITAATVLDPYVVVGNGVRIRDWSLTRTGVKESGTERSFVCEIKPGIRWFFTPRINLWAEGGFGTYSAITLGAGVRF